MMAQDESVKESKREVEASIFCLKSGLKLILKVECALE